MLEAILWGLVQGLTEFLPVSSSGHLVLVPAFLGVDPPDLATSAVLHLGTLAAVVLYYRRDLLDLAGFHRNPAARRTLMLLAVGTVPAVVAALLFESTVESIQESPRAVGAALIVTGLVLFGSGAIRRGMRVLENARVPDAVTVGLAQAAALVPGISRSGMTITAGMSRKLTDIESARYSFLLAVPVIAGGGILEALDLAETGGLQPEMAIGVLVAAVSGYAAIAVLIRALAKIGLRPFSFYCVVVGLAAIAFL